MMTQGMPPFQYQPEKSESGLTSFSGLFLYLDLAMVTGLCQTIALELNTKSRRWSDVQIIISLVLLNLAGSDCVDDIDRLEADDALRTLLLNEQGILLHSEFRDGNVPAGFEQLRLIKEFLALLPPGVETVCLRSNSAGYQQDLMKYCAECKNERFGIIEFAISARVTAAFRQAVNSLQESSEPMPHGGISWCWLRI